MNYARTMLTPSMFSRRRSLYGTVKTVAGLSRGYPIIIVIIGGPIMIIIIIISNNNTIIRVI